MLHVDDVARALMALADADGLSGMAVNVGSGEGHAIREMAERAARRLGVDRLLRFGAIPRRSGDVEQVVANVDRLASTGFRPRLHFESAVDHAADEICALALVP